MTKHQLRAIRDVRLIAAAAGVVTLWGVTVSAAARELASPALTVAVVLGLVGVLVTMRVIVSVGVRSRLSAVLAVIGILAAGLLIEHGICVSLDLDAADRTAVTVIGAIAQASAVAALVWRRSTPLVV
ncbi:hypothetical protein [Streptacidiphilus sp. MAP5-52]|uniref:hypothetical protein n=1 Tax=Streptacidiphilus sp. MAP5-52 TaxID=3156267 RepID=UPI003515AA1F